MTWFWVLWWVVFVGAAAVGAAATNLTVGIAACSVLIAAIVVAVIASRRARGRLPEARRDSPPPSLPVSHTDQHPVRYRRHVTRQQSPMRVVSGHLIVDDAMIRFVPSHAERLIGGRAWATSANDVAAVEVRPPLGQHVPLGYRLAPWAGRRRLVVRLSDGSAEAFISTRLRVTADRLRTAIGVRGAEQDAIAD